MMNQGNSNVPIGFNPHVHQNQPHPPGYYATGAPAQPMGPSGQWFPPPQGQQQFPQGQQQYYSSPQQQFYGQNQQPGFAPGLQPLYGTDRIVIKQKKEMLEIFTNWETSNKYEIFNSSGQQIFYAIEDTSGLAMCFFGENRPFCIRVLDRNGQQVMVINSSVDCCTRQVTVEIPPGQLAAQINQEFAFMAPSFYVNNPGGNLMFKVKSPMTAAFGSFGNTNFDILSSDQKTVVGQITKQWGGFFREAFTDADTFGLSVPADMDVNWKAVLLAVTFVVDFEFYEKSNRRN